MSLFNRRIAVVVGGLFAVAACAAPMPDDSPLGDVREVDPVTSDENKDSPAPVGDPSDPEQAEDPPPAPACEGQTAAYDPVVPRTNVLFVLDRSGSMHTPLPKGGTRWTATRNALFSVLDKLPKQNARASVLQFPQGDASLASCCDIDANNQAVCSCASYPAPTKRCSASTYNVSVPAQLDAAKIGSIKSSINASNNTFFWGTPLAAAMSAAVNAQKSSTNDGIKTIVLLTDGVPASCESTSDPGANDIKRVIDAAKLGMAGTQKVRTFVLGIMDGASGARADLLSQVATAGGTPRTASCNASDSCFYSVDAATSLSTLTSTLERIARESTDCTFDLPAATPTTDLAKIDVTLAQAGKSRILVHDKTHRDGWDLLTGNKQFKLFGGACTALKEDAKAKVQIVVGCSTGTK